MKKKQYLCTALKVRGVAQLVRVHVWGARGRQFESAHPDKGKGARIVSSRCLKRKRVKQGDLV